MNPPRVYTCSQSWTPPPNSLPIPSLWVIPVHQPQASCILHRIWTGDSFHIWYYTCFNAILSNHPTLSLSLSHRVQKSVLYICVSFAVLHTRLSLPSFYIPYICASILYWCFSFWLTSLCIIGSSFIHLSLSFPSGSVVKNSPAMQEPQETRVQSLGWEGPWKSRWQPTLVFLPGKSHGQRSLVGDSP